jgi:hypothetical protein
LEKAYLFWGIVMTFADFNAAWRDAVRQAAERARDTRRRGIHPASELEQRMACAKRIEALEVTFAPLRPRGDK